MHALESALACMLPADAPSSSLFERSDGVFPSVPGAGQPLQVCSMHGQVMTDEQFETLRRQISVYATICQQLVEMHRAMVAQQKLVAGLGECILYDPAIHPAGIKLTSRQRWTPSQKQLELLEKYFEQGIGNPNKRRIKEITAELIQHGQISETNVYNWFQNRRARSKRRQSCGLLQNDESEVETEGDSFKEKRVKADIDGSKELFWS